MSRLQVRHGVRLRPAFDEDGERHPWHWARFEDGWRAAGEVAIRKAMAQQVAAWLQAKQTATRDAGDLAQRVSRLAQLPRQDLQASVPRKATIYDAAVRAGHGRKTRQSVPLPVVAA